MGNKLKIASWNIDSKRKKDDKFIHIINDLLDNNEIVVLNEVCFKHKEIIDKIANERKNMFDYIVNKVNDVGYIMMFISKTRFEHITVDNDYCLFGMSIIYVLASNAKNEMVRILGVHQVPQYCMTIPERDKYIAILRMFKKRLWIVEKNYMKIVILLSHVMQISTEIY